MNKLLASLSSIARVIAMTGLLPVPIVGLSVVAAGCSSPTEDCIVGTPGCRCNASGSCAVPQLTCRANVCVLGTPGNNLQPGQGGGGGSPSGQGGQGGGVDPLVAAPTTPTAGSPGNGGPVVLVPAPPTSPPPGGARDAAPPAPSSGVDAGGGQTLPGGPSTPGAQGTWTIFVYGHGDHNLTPSLVRDIQEMMVAKISPNIRVVVLADWNSQTDASGTEKFPAGGFWYLVPGNGAKAEVVGTIPEPDLDDPNVLASAIKSAFTSYPSERYGVILWDHGGGWLGGFGGDDQNDTRRGRGMRVDSVAKAVRAGLTAAGLTGKRRLDFLSFDTCLLATTEVAAEFSDVAKVYMANAELDYGDGLDYEGMLTWLSANATASVSQFAAAEVKAWDDHHKNASLGDRLFRSHVALDAEKLEALPAAFAKLSAAAQAGGAGAISRALFESVPSYLRSGDDESDSGSPPSRDVGFLLQKLKASTIPALAAAATQTLDVMTAAKIAGAHGDLRQGQMGVGIFGGPLLGIDARAFPLYPNLAATWERASGWGAMLAAAKAAAPSTKPTVQGMAVVPMAPTQVDPPRIDFSVTGADAAFVGALLAQIAPGSQTKLNIWGAVGASLVSGQGVLKWNGRKVVLDTEQKTPVTVMPWEYVVKGTTLSTALRKVPGYLQSASRRMEGSLIIDDNGLATSAVIKVEGGEGVTSLSRLFKVLGEGSMFVPRVQYYDGGTKQLAWESSQWGVLLNAGGVIRFKEEVAAPDIYGVMLTVDDSWGNSTTQGFVWQLASSVGQ